MVMGTSFTGVKLITLIRRTQFAEELQPQSDFPEFSGVMALHCSIFYLMAVFFGSTHSANDSTAQTFSARELVAQGIEALGGSENLSRISSVSYVGGE